MSEFGVSGVEIEVPKKSNSFGRALEVDAFDGTGYRTNCQLEELDFAKKGEQSITYLERSNIRSKLLPVKTSPSTSKDFESIHDGQYITEPPVRQWCTQK
jgi:hypothetical protein